MATTKRRPAPPAEPTPGPVSLTPEAAVNLFRTGRDAARKSLDAVQATFHRRAEERDLVDAIESYALDLTRWKANVAAWEQAVQVLERSEQPSAGSFDTLASVVEEEIIRILFMRAWEPNSTNPVRSLIKGARVAGVAEAWYDIRQSLQYVRTQLSQ